MTQINLTDNFQRNFNYMMGLRETRIMRSETAYNTYYTNKTGLRHEMSLGRAGSKKLLREWLEKNGKELLKTNIVISYITNKGIHYLDPQLVMNLSDIAKLLADPLVQKGPSDESNSAIIGPNTLVYGIIIQYMKIPEIVEVTKKVTKRVIRRAPRLTEPSFDTGASL